MTSKEQTRRYLAAYIKEDLGEKVVFVGGPRQVGKTTLAKSLLSHGAKDSYFNWDNLEHRERLLQHSLPSRQKLIVLDEVHKYARWRTLIKGFYDSYAPEVSFVVTGSARLDYYRKGGDSLQGRYFYYRLHPFSLAEIDKGYKFSTVEQLYRCGGFPEPFLRGNATFYARWNRSRIERVVYGDLDDLERINEISLIEHLVTSFPERVGTPISLNALSTLLDVSSESVGRWIEMLERLYFCFRVTPYQYPRIKAVKKEKKLYFWDWAQAPDGGARFENMVASHLLKYCNFLEDTEGARTELCFLRDVTGREIDFVVVKDKRPLFAVECKYGEKDESPALQYFSKRTKIPKFYQTHMGTKDCLGSNSSIRILPFATLCQELGLP